MQRTFALSVSFFAALSASACGNASEENESINELSVLESVQDHELDASGDPPRDLPAQLPPNHNLPAALPANHNVPPPLPANHTQIFDCVIEFDRILTQSWQLCHTAPDALFCPEGCTDAPVRRYDATLQRSVKTCMPSNVAQCYALASAAPLKPNTLGFSCGSFLLSNPGPGWANPIKVIKCTDMAGVIAIQ